MSTTTTTKMQDFARLTEIKNNLASQQPDLDNIVPLFEETSQIEDRLKSYFKSTKDVLSEKRKNKDGQS